MTEDWKGHETFAGTGWANTEFRSFGWKEGDEGVEGRFSLVETDESVARRVEKPLGRAETRIYEDNKVPN